MKKCCVKPGDFVVCDARNRRADFAVWFGKNRYDDFDVKVDSKTLRESLITVVFVKKIENERRCDVENTYDITFFVPKYGLVHMGDHSAFFISPMFRVVRFDR